MGSGENKDFKQHPVRWVILGITGVLVILGIVLIAIWVVNLVT